MKAFWEAHPAIGRLRHLNETELRFARILAPHVHDKRVLDLGCGGGKLSAYLAAQGASVVGVDFSAPLIAAANANFQQDERLHFLEADILHLDLGEQFDIICGIAVLHEIAYPDTVQLINMIDIHLKPSGFGWFMENSFFNPAFRFARKYLVGKYGIPKVGSAHEIPFDRQRFALYKEHFRFCGRSAESFLLFTLIHSYLIRSGNQQVRNWCRWMDSLVLRLHLPDALLRNLSYWQHIYFSHTRPKKEALSVISDR
jgi:SAM-dependent methyltransferase